MTTERTQFNSIAIIRNRSGYTLATITPYTRSDIGHSWDKASTNPRVYPSLPPRLCPTLTPASIQRLNRYMEEHTLDESPAGYYELITDTFTIAAMTLR